jgi:hypothetical protein
MKKKSIFFQPAFLWDGSKRLAGNLELKSEILVFHFENFKDSNLELRIHLEKIVKTELYRLYDIEIKGLKVFDNEGRTNIFILQDPEKLKKELKK